jgi:hypothetical protein
MPGLGGVSVNSLPLKRDVGFAQITTGMAGGAKTARGPEKPAPFVHGKTPVS